MHHIQRKILNKLIYARHLGYAQMRPAGVESNHFAYHLEQLLRQGIIAKRDREYSLTARGLALADRSSHESMKVRMQPNIVTSVYITNGVGQLLLYEHLFQPYLNKFGVPQGRVHYEEHIAVAAVRELAEKAGLTDLPLTHRGMVYIHATKEGEDISKILAHVFTGTIEEMPVLRAPTVDGKTLWRNPAELDPADCMPGFKEVQKLLQNAHSELFFAEIEAELK